MIQVETCRVAAARYEAARAACDRAALAAAEKELVDALRGITDPHKPVSIGGIDYWFERDPYPDLHRQVRGFVESHNGPATPEAINLDRSPVPATEAAARAGIDRGTFLLWAGRLGVPFAAKGKRGDRTYPPEAILAVRDQVRYLESLEDDPDLLTISEIAARYGLSREGARNQLWSYRGEIRPAAFGIRGVSYYSARDAEFVFGVAARERRIAASLERRGIRRESLDHLPEREREIILGRAAGETYPEIARRLRLSPSRVRQLDAAGRDRAELAGVA